MEKKMLIVYYSVSNGNTKAVADSTNITAGCCKKLTHDEIYEILMECK